VAIGVLRVDVARGGSADYSGKHISGGRCAIS